MDNPALAQAAARGEIIPIFVFDDTVKRPLGAASCWWLNHSLSSLRNHLGGLLTLRGDPIQIIPKIVKQIGIGAVFWNRCYDDHAISRDKLLKASLRRDGVWVQSFNANLLHEPWEILTQTGNCFRVFSPFWRKARQLPVSEPIPAPKLRILTPKKIDQMFDTVNFLPRNPKWADDWLNIWKPGECGARERLNDFFLREIEGYGSLRDRPDIGNVSRLSPHLRFGEISPRYILQHARLQREKRPQLAKDIEKFISEIGWREFSYHQLFYFPSLHTRNLRSAFDAYPWRNDPAALHAWQQGKTGYPFVDAGIRQLWRTGYMHNRVRMVVASFLVKHLQIDWRRGEAWFWNTLLDADPANNPAGWQWVAGSGADSAPYFRIFNPIVQGRKFDPTGAYVRKWCPELTGLADKVIHAPFKAPREILKVSGVRLGVNYPYPIVSHEDARAAALAGYEEVKRSSALRTL